MSLFSGVLSIVLVVGDTWCAVTDPLRYHSRISYLKSWVLIASVWIISILFSVVSALRSTWCTVEEATQNNISTMKIASAKVSNDVASIYVLVFSCVFFVFVILIPILLVCIMYWNIFSEARQSGLRMRRNGSSPLLQSSLNLHNSGLNAVSENQRYPSLFDISSPDVLTMKIDSKQFDDSKKDQPIATHQYRRYLDVPELENQQNQQQQQQKQKKRERTKSERSLSSLKPRLVSQFRSTFSARHLVEPSCDAYQVPSFLTRSHNLSRMLTGEMRQVHSTPNLQKLTNTEMLQKIPYCLNNRSTASINQTTAQQASSNSPRALSYMISIRHRLSNASSIFKYREESRAARIGIVVVAMFMLSYLPYGILILSQGRITFIPNASLCSILCLLIANISTPFIFAYRNRRVRRGVCRLFGVDTKSNSYLQKQRMQLKNSQSNGGNGGSGGGSAKHVRIHRNLSASNFSINMLPYKFATHSMLPIKQYEQQQQQQHANLPGNRHGSFLVPIDDVEIETTDTLSQENLQTNENIEKTLPKTNDLNNNLVENKKEKKTLFKRMFSNSSQKTCTEIVNQTETKDDAI